MAEVITYEDKDKSLPSSNPRKLFRDVDANEVKDVVNDNSALLDLKAPLASPVLTGTPTAPTPTANDNSQKIATTQYVDNAALGIVGSWKNPVRLATAVAGTLASSFENGDTVDGVALVTGDRILIKDQVAQTENGIYIVAVSGAPTRSSDANSGAELEGAAVTVQLGTANANKTFIQTTDNVTLGSSNIIWSQLGTSVPDADASTKGVAKLYTSTGTNTDGSMDQNSINTALGLKANLAGSKVVQFASSDETTPLTTGTNKIRFRMPYAMTLSAVRASLGTAQASGSIFTVDINESGSTILSTKLTINNTEKTSTTAATAAVISDTSLADDAEITIDVDQIGNGTASGLKITLIGS